MKIKTLPSTILEGILNHYNAQFRREPPPKPERLGLKNFATLTWAHCDLELCVCRPQRARQSTTRRLRNFKKLTDTLYTCTHWGAHRYVIIGKEQIAIVKPAPSTLLFEARTKPPFGNAWRLCYIRVLDKLDINLENTANAIE